MQPSVVLVQLRALQKEDRDQLFTQLGEPTTENVPDLLSPLLLIILGFDPNMKILSTHGPAVANDAQVVKDIWSKRAHELLHQLQICLTQDGFPPIDKVIRFELDDVANQPNPSVFTQLNELL